MAYSKHDHSLASKMLNEALGRVANGTATELDQLKVIQGAILQGVDNHASASQATMAVMEKLATALDNHAELLEEYLDNANSTGKLAAAKKAAPVGLGGLGLGAVVVEILRLFLA